MFREFVVWYRQSKAEQEQQTRLAWQIATLSRATKIPSLDTLLRKAKRQTLSEQADQVMTLAQQYGIQLRPASQTRMKQAR